MINQLSNFVFENLKQIPILDFVFYSGLIVLLIFAKALKKINSSR